MKMNEGLPREYRYGLLFLGYRMATAGTPTRRALAGQRKT
jgi:hypothetical protein